MPDAVENGIFVPARGERQAGIFAVPEVENDGLVIHGDEELPDVEVVMIFAVVAALGSEKDAPRLCEQHLHLRIPRGAVRAHRCNRVRQNAGHLRNRCTAPPEQIAERAQRHAHRNRLRRVRLLPGRRIDRLEGFHEIEQFRAAGALAEPLQDTGVDTAHAGRTIRKRRGPFAADPCVGHIARHPPEFFGAVKGRAGAVAGLAELLAKQKMSRRRNIPIADALIAAAVFRIVVEIAHIRRQHLLREGLQPLAVEHRQPGAEHIAANPGRPVVPAAVPPEPLDVRLNRLNRPLHQPMVNPARQIRGNVVQRMASHRINERKQLSGLRRKQIDHLAVRIGQGVFRCGVGGEAPRRLSQNQPDPIRHRIVEPPISLERLCEEQG